MADVFTKAKRSEVMSLIRGRGNKTTELALVALFRQHQITGWRRQVQVRISEFRTRSSSRGNEAQTENRKPATRRAGARARRVANRKLVRASSRRLLQVRPDFVFSKARLAVFVDGCFWHGCPKHGTQPVGNRAFWRNKLARNKARDRIVNRTLRQHGWTVLRIWQHELSRKGETRLLRRIHRVLG